MSRVRSQAEQIFQKVSEQYILGAPNVKGASEEIKNITNFWVDGMTSDFNELVSSFVKSPDLVLLLDRIIVALLGDIYRCGDCIRQTASCFLEAIHRGLFNETTQVCMVGEENEIIHTFLKLDLAKDVSEWVQVDPWQYNSIVEHADTTVLDQPQRLYPDIDSDLDLKKISMRTVKLNEELDYKSWAIAAICLDSFRRQLTQRRVEQLLKTYKREDVDPCKELEWINAGIRKREQWCLFHFLWRRPPLPAPSFYSDDTNAKKVAASSRKIDRHNAKNSHFFSGENAPYHLMIAGQNTGQNREDQALAKVSTSPR